MTEKLQQAAQQALAALDELYYSNSTPLAEKLYEESSAALRAALAEQPAEQEPGDARYALAMLVDPEKLEPWQLELYDKAMTAPQPKAEPQSLSDAMATVIAAMQADPDYAWSWHCTVAMAFVAAGGDHYTANQGAARFMKLLAKVEPAHDLPEAPQPKREPLTDEEIQDLLKVGNPTEDEYRLIRMGWNAAHRVGGQI